MHSALSRTAYLYFVNFLYEECYTHVKVKALVVPVHAMRANKESRGVVDLQSQPCMKVSEQLHTLAARTPGDGPPPSAH